MARLLASSENSNVPFEFLFRQQEKKKEKEGELRPPSPYKLSINNEVYQVATFVSSSGKNASFYSFYLFSAFLDDRDRLPVVRLLGFADVVDPKDKLRLSCRLWWEDGESRTVPVSDYLLLYPAGWNSHTYGDGKMQPYLVNCQLRDTAAAPAAVSIVQEGSGNAAAANCVKVLDRRIRGKDDEEERVRGLLGVCVQALNFPFRDISIRSVFLAFGVPGSTYRVCHNFFLIFFFFFAD